MEDSTDEIENFASLEDSTEKVVNFCIKEELFVGYGKEYVAPIQMNVKYRISNSAERKFFRSLIDVFSPLAAELLSENKIMDLLSDSYGGMNSNAICQLFLQLTQNILNSSHFYDIPDVVRNELLQLQDSLTGYLKQELDENNVESTVSSGDSSLGILDLSNLSSIGNETFEAVCEQSSVQCDSIVYIHEIEDLQCQNKKICDENKALKSQLSVLEDMNNTLMQEIQKLEKQLLNLQDIEREMKDLSSKHDSLRQGQSILENSKESACQRVVELEKEKHILEKNIMYLGEKLQLAHMDSETKQKEVLSLKDSLVKSDLCKQDSLEAKQNIEIELIERKLKCDELELALTELMESNQALRRDYGLIEDELEKAKENVNKHFEVFSNLSSPTESSPVSSNSFFHLITSTPDVNLSICTEMNNVNSSTFNENLPLPYCGKKKSSTTSSKIPSMQYKKQLLSNGSFENNKCTPKTNPSAMARRKNLSKQMNTDRSLDRVSDHGDCDVSICSQSTSRRTFNSRGDTTANWGNSAAELSMFLHLLSRDLSSLCKFVENINSQAKAAFKIELDLAQLEEKLLEAKGQSLELEINSKTGADSSMPPHSAADSDRGDTKRTSDSSSQVIRDQISAEIKALKTQLIRSHALLSYLQEKEKYSSTSFSPDVSSPLPRKSSGSQRGKLLQQKSLDTQASSFFPHYSQKDSVSIGSHRSTPLHIIRSHSCPIFQGDQAVVCKSTQTDIAATQKPRQMPSQRYETVWIRPNASRYSECSSTSEMSSKSADNLECGTCEVHPIQEEEAPSPHLPRHRTNSFLSAVSTTTTTTNHLSPGDSSQCDSSQLSNVRSKTENRRKSLQSRRVVKIAQQTGQDEKVKDVSAEAKKLCPAEEVKSEKSFKTPQRSMRRGSGAGSPNSLTSIPRYPAFDLDEQDEERSLTTSSPVNVVSLKKSTEEAISPKSTDGSSEQKDSLSKVKETPPSVKRDSGKAMLMPEAAENSETESAKGSFECESSQVPAAISEIAVPDTAFPNIPNSLLTKLGISKNYFGDAFNEQELESKFMTLSLAFKTDKMTLSKRLELHKRQRDVAEKDVDEEIKAIRDSLNYLNLNATTTETRDVIAKIQTHVDIVSLATSKVSARSETYGAVKQEERVSCAFEVMLQHVENLRRLFDKEHRELEETKRILGGNQTPTKRTGMAEDAPATDDHHRHHKSLKTLGLAIGTVKSVVRRRASVADLNSLPGVSRLASWSSGFAVDTRNRRISALLPITSSSSVATDSTSPPPPTIKHPSCQPSDMVNRRCSLPTSPLASREKDTHHHGKNNSDLKISITPTLSPVADEEPSEEEEVPTSQMVSLRVPKFQPSAIIAGAQLLIDNRRDSPSRRLSRYLAVQDAADSSDDGQSDISTDRTESEQWTRPRFSRLRRFWTATSGLNLVRYCVSVVLAVSAFVVLVNTFLPSDKCYASDEHLLPVVETIERLLYKPSRTAPVV